METSPSRSSASGEATLRKPTQSRPTLTVPLRNPVDAFSKASDLATTPSPMTFVSSLFADQDPYSDYKSFSQLLAGDMSPTAQTGGGFGPAPAESSQGSDAPSTQRGTDKLPPPPQGGTGIIGAPSRPSTARFKSMMPSRLPIPRSPYLTIPPGLSPTTLLDSPVLLSMAQAEPSPTTGTFPLPSFLQDDVAPSTDKFRGISDEDGSSTFVFKPHLRLPMSPLSSMAPFGFSHQQPLAQVHAEEQVQVSSSSGGDASVPEPTVMEASPPFTVSIPQSHSEEHAESTPPQLHDASERTSSQLSAQAAFPPPHLIERPSDDGYNWRKYGQKQVKGSEYPRSYYKCTHPNCPVKKKVERSYDGQITEIVYKGEHNHARPQHTRRSSGMSGGSHMTDREISHSSAMERGGKGEELSILARGQLAPYSGCTPEPSLGSTSDDEREDGDVVKIEDGGEDEPDSKRRRSEKTRESSPNAPLRTIREPRVVVQTMSEVDILDDGYRWRKYGQKQVKGNPYPRSYYKCTNVGCSVRKHVERSSTDSKAVITTYEGKHNHDVPAARNNHHHDASGNAASAPPPSSVRGVSTQRTLQKSATSLQEQFLGKYQVAGINTMMREQSMGQGDEGVSYDAGRSIINPFLNGVNSHERSDFLGRGVGLKPKEEPGDVHPLGSSIPSTYHSSSSSFVAQSLML